MKIWDGDFPYKTNQSIHPKKRCFSYSSHKYFLFNLFYSRLFVVVTQITAKQPLIIDSVSPPQKYLALLRNLLGKQNGTFLCRNVFARFNLSKRILQLFQKYLYTYIHSSNLNITPLYCFGNKQYWAKPRLTLPESIIPNQRFLFIFKNNLHSLLKTLLFFLFKPTTSSL